MGLPAFDTLQIFEALEKAGFEESKAKAISAVVRRAHESSDFATKRDIDDLRKDMDAKFAGVDAKFAAMEERFDAKFAGVNARFVSMEERFDAKLERMGSGLRQEMSDMKFALIKWIVGLGIAQTGLWFTLKLHPTCRGISNAPLPNSSQRRFQRPAARAMTQRRPSTPVNGRALHPIPHRALQRPIHRVPASSFWCAARWLSAIVAPQSSPI